VIFSKALMEATGRHQPKGSDLEDMYAFLPGQLGGSDRSDDSPVEKPPAAKLPVIPVQADPARKGARAPTGASTRANSRKKGLVWKPKVSVQHEAACAAANPALFRCGGC